MSLNAEFKIVKGAVSFISIPYNLLSYKTIHQIKSSEQILNTYLNKMIWDNKKINFKKRIMNDQKPLFKAPYDIKDVSALFAIVAFVLVIAAIVGNNLFGIFQQNVNFG